MRLGLQRLDIYVLTRTLVSVLGALAIIGTVIVLIDFVEISRDLGSRVEIDPLHVFGLTMMKSPMVLLILLPFIFLFGTLGAFVTLNRRSELTAMRAAGVSAWRFIMPAASAAFVVGLLSATVLNPIATRLNDRFEAAKAAIMQEYRPDSPKEVWIRQGRGSTQMVIHALSSNNDPQQLVLKGVSLYIYTLDRQGNLDFQRRIEASEARLLKGEWRLSSVREATAGQVAQTSEQMAIPSTVSEAAAIEKFASPNTVPFWSLPKVIKRADEAGLAATAYQVRLQQLIATPVLLAAMSVLAAAFCLRLVRLGGLAGLAGAGVALGFAFFFFDQLCGALGRADIIPPYAAAWSPPLLALLSGLTLLCYTEDG